MMAFAGMLNESLSRAGAAETDGKVANGLHHPARAKRVIFLFMNGGLSQVDSFDPKPALAKYDGQPLPGGTVATERKTGALMQSPFQFKKYGQCGMEVSELFPHVGECADDICWVRSVYTDIPNHEPSMLMMNTGFSQVGRPSLGSWLTYGLGTENKNLPGYVVLCPDVPTTVGPPLWNNAFLPPIHQGTFIGDKVSDKQTVEKLVEPGFDPAVRLVEKGVRMVQVYYAKGDPWDAHADIQAHRKNAKDSDQPFAAVIKDLKSRGLFKDTLVVCGSEFGRTPVREVGGGAGSIGAGRDHNPFGFTMWMAGGGVKGGTIYGATDDFGFKAVEKPVHVHDMHATILHLMGIDHTKLTYRYSGRDFRLTDVSGTVLHDLIS